MPAIVSPRTPSVSVTVPVPQPVPAPPAGYGSGQWVGGAPPSPVGWPPSPPQPVAAPPGYTGSPPHGTQAAAAPAPPQAPAAAKDRGPFRRAPVTAPHALVFPALPRSRR